MFWRKKRKQALMESMGSMMEAAAYRDRMDALLEKFAITPDGLARDSVRGEILAFSKLIAHQIVERSGQQIPQLTDNEMIVLMLFGFVAADRLTRITQSDVPQVSRSPSLGEMMKLEVRQWHEEVLSASSSWTRCAWSVNAA